MRVLLVSLHYKLNHALVSFVFNWNEVEQGTRNNKPKNKISGLFCDSISLFCSIKLNAFFQFFIRLNLMEQRRNEMNQIIQIPFMLSVFLYLNKHIILGILQLKLIIYFSSLCFSFVHHFLLLIPPSSSRCSRLIQFKAKKRKGITLCFYWIKHEWREGRGKKEWTKEVRWMKRVFLSTPLSRISCFI